MGWSTRFLTQIIPLESGVVAAAPEILQPAPPSLIRNVAARKAAAVLIALSPSLFLTEAPAQFTTSIQDAVNQPIFRKAYTAHRAPYFFAPELPQQITQPQSAVSQPLPRAPSRRHLAPSFFFIEDPVRPLSAVFNRPPPVPRRTHVLAPYFFAPQAIAEFPFEFEVSVTKFQPRRDVQPTTHLQNGFFFGEAPAAFNTQIHDAVSQPLPRPPSKIHLYPSSVLVEFPAEFNTQIENSLSQPFRVLVRTAHRAPAFFFQESLVFTGQPFDAVSQPLPRALHTAHLAPFFFFGEVPTQVFPITQQVDPVRRPPSRVHTFPSLFYSISEAAETIYVPSWYQPIVQPARNLIVKAQQRQFIISAAPSLTLQGDIIVADVFIPFGVITRSLAAPTTKVYFEVIMRTSNASFPAKARLFNITDATDVAGSTISTTSLTNARVRSSAITLNASAKEYRVEFTPEAICTIYSGDLIFGP